MSQKVCGPERLDIGWTSLSKMTCSIECRKKFPNNCFGFLYNRVTTQCVPTSGLSPYWTPPTVDEGSFYFQDVCNAYPYFKQRTAGYNTLTVGWFSNPLNYSQAGRSCACLNARLFVANETNRLLIYQAESFGVTSAWLGLDDIISENTFIWADGQPLSSYMTPQIFNLLIPDIGTSNKDCVARNSFDNFFSETDCSEKLAYICEKPMCEIIN
ncbi:CD209 antigen-like protein B [Biomphalaria glabrata]|nr:CD209 antigen-like protein B [Biomphalaria glabrata]